MNSITVFSPGHVTGLFYVPPLPEDPLLQSSIGAGFSVTKGVSTRIRRQGPSEKGIHVFIDGAEHKAPVSRKVIEIFEARTGKTIKESLRIEHESELPHGSGFGTSGAGALGLAVGLCRLFQTGFSPVEAAQIAHMAEVICRTGLGTVMGELTGGIKLLVKRGAPGIGKTEPIPFAENLRALFVAFGPFPTDQALEDPEMMGNINRIGRALHEELKAAPCLDRFLECSNRFSRSLGLLSEECNAVLTLFEEFGAVGGMHFFGNGVFTLLEKNKAETLAAILESRIARGRIFTCGIEKEGCKIIDEY